MSGDSRNDSHCPDNLGIVLGGTPDQEARILPEVMCCLSNLYTNHQVRRISLSAPAGVLEVSDNASFDLQLLISGGTRSG